MKLNCIMCPLGCEIEIAKSKAGEFLVSGNSCIRGEQYAKNEMIRPLRAVSSLAIIEKGGVVPVKTSGLVPKDKIDDVIAEIGKIRLSNYPDFGTVIIKDVLNLGVDVISIGY